MNKQMYLQLLPTADSATEEEFAGKVVVVIDVLRATSVITTALQNGALEVIPAVTIEEAVGHTADARGTGCAAETTDTDTDTDRAAVLLGGERNALKIAGFHLSNSPLEYVKEVVAGKKVVITTTNGTKALHRSRNAENIYIGSMLNGRAVAEKVATTGRDAMILCAGTDGKFSLDDFLCAGKIIFDIITACDTVGKKDLQFDDLAYAAFAMYKDSKDHLLSMVKEARHCQRLISIGLWEDVKYCFTEDMTEIVPEFRDGRIKTFVE